MQNQNLNESVSAEIRAEMARRRMTQRELAISLGWHQSQLAKRLTSKIAFTTTELEQIAAALGIPLTGLTSPRAVAG